MEQPLPNKRGVFDLYLVNTVHNIQPQPQRYLCFLLFGKTMLQSSNSQ